MPRWLRVVRGMLGTGLAFAVSVGAVGTLFGLVGALAGQWPLTSIVVVGRFAVAGFVLGVAFSGLLALVARGRRFEKLSLPFFTSLGVGVGLIYFALISLNGIGTWSLQTAIVNLLLLTGFGGGSAAAILMIARRAERLRAPDEPLEIADMEDRERPKPIGR